MNTYQVLYELNRGELLQSFLAHAENESVATTQFSEYATKHGFSTARVVKVRFLHQDVEIFENAKAVQLSTLSKGEYFKRKPYSKKVYIRKEYYQDTKKYQCDDCDDVLGNGLQLKGSTIVYIGFDY